MFEEGTTFRGFNGNELVGTLYGHTGTSGILCCHGLAGAKEDFGTFPERLAEVTNSRVLTFDYSGHGESAGTRGLLTAESHERDTFQAINVLLQQGLTSVTVLGHSLGAYSALNALQRKEVTAAILICPSRKSGDNLAWHKKILAFVGGWFYCIFGELIRREIYIRNGPSGKEINARYLSYALKVDNLKMGRRAIKPILLVACARDQAVAPKKSRQLYSAIGCKRKQFIVLEKSDHVPFDGPEQGLLVNGIASFLKSL